METIVTSEGFVVGDIIYPLPKILQITIGKDCIISMEEIENDDDDWGNYVIVDC